MYLLADKLGEIVSGAYSWVGLIWLKLSAQTKVLLASEGREQIQ